MIKEFTGTWHDIQGRGERLMLVEKRPGMVELLWHAYKEGQIKILRGRLNVGTFVASGPVYETRSRLEPSWVDRLLRREPKRQPWGFAKVYYLNDHDLFLEYRRVRGGAYGYRMNADDRTREARA